MSKPHPIFSLLCGGQGSGKHGYSSKLGNCGTLWLICRVMNPEQLDLNFVSQTGSADGIVSWRQNRRTALKELARKNGIPLGCRVRVDFAAGPPLEGMLFLDEETLLLPDKADAHLRLRIGTASFHKDEVSSIIVLEGPHEES